MTFRVLLHRGLGEDLHRVVEHLHRFEIEGVGERVAAIKTALQVLSLSPWIGRPAGASRELIIGQGARAYVARYAVDEARREVHVLALRHAREDGFKR